jgi:hypothetical protein
MNPAQPDDETIRRAIGTLLRARRPGGSICPSDAARALGVTEWRLLMPRVRAVAAAMADAGELVVTQKDAIVDARTARGPIRLRLPHAPG